MRKITLTIYLLASALTSIYAQSDMNTSNDMVITGVFDGPLAGGTPKAIELYVLSDIADLSIYGVGNANNGGGTDGQEFTFPIVSATAGEFIYISYETSLFNDFFGFDPDYNSGAANINGDDAIELFQNNQVIDTFGEISFQNSGEQDWLYTDGWAYRSINTGPDGTFVMSNWSFSGTGSNNDDTNHASATNSWPIKTFASTLSTNRFNEFEINLYPNPVFGGILSVESSSNDTMDIEIFNMLGQRVLTSRTFKTINVSNLNSGIYLVKVNQGSASLTKKVIIK